MVLITTPFILTNIRSYTRDNHLWEMRENDKKGTVREGTIFNHLIYVHLICNVAYQCKIRRETSKSQRNFLDLWWNSHSVSAVPLPALIKLMYYFVLVSFFSLGQTTVTCVGIPDRSKFTYNNKIYLIQVPSRFCCNICPRYLRLCTKSNVE